MRNTTPFCPSQNATRTRHANPLRQFPLKSLVAALSTVLGFGHAAGVMAASNISKNDKAGTTVTLTTAGTHTTFDITTTTLSSNGHTAFNSFRDFYLASGDTVNMNLPHSASNLVNLVWDTKTVINGTLNSYVGGKIGGNVFFADPHGIVVGAGATLNVGALSLSAPTSDFMKTLLKSDGSLNGDSAQVTLLLTGQEPLAASSNSNCSNDIASNCDGKVYISGTIKANNAVRVRATAIDVSGTIYVAGNGSDVLSTAVNVAGQSAPNIVSDGNTIRLVSEANDETGLGDAKADASVKVSGTLTTSRTASAPNSPDKTVDSWGLVEATAHAEATSDFSTPTSSASTVQRDAGQVGNLFKDQDSLLQNGFAAAAQDVNLAASDMDGQVAYVRASATATVDISGKIDAAGDVTLASSTVVKAATEATSEAGDKAAPVMVGAMYGGIYSNASTTVDSGATVHTGDVSSGALSGALSVDAETDNKLDIAADTVAGDQVLATTVAWSQAAVQSTSKLDGNIKAQSIGVLAHNINSFSTEAKSETNPTTGSVGVAGAVSLQSVRADAELNASPIVTGGSGDVIVAAGNTTSKNSTSAETSTDAESTENTEDETGSTNADLSGMLSNRTNEGLNEDGSSSSDSLPFHLGAAVAYTDSKQSSSATIGDNVTINTDGNVAVYSDITDAGIHNGAQSAAVSEADSDSTGAIKADISAAVAYGNYVHDSSATIGSSANIEAANIGVGSSVNVPFDWSFDTADNVDSVKNMFGSLDNFMAGIGAINDLSDVGPETITGGVSGFASATAGGDSEVAVGGSVNYFAMTNANKAWVGDGSTLTATSAAAATPGEDSWKADIKWLDTPVEWKHSLDVNATTDVTLFNLVGDITPWEQGTEGDKAAVGGAFNYLGYSNENVAGVGADASLVSDYNDVAVNATSTERMIALSPVSGKGGTLSLQGTVAITDINDTTHASISAGTNVTARALEVVASNPVMIWSLSGALAMSDKASIGLSVGINQITTDTLASIGDNHRDDPVVIAGGSAPAQTDGVISVAKLNLNAVSSGEAGAMSVAGSAGGPSDDPSGGSGDTGSDGEAGSGESLMDLIENIKTVNEDFQTGLAVVDGVSTLSGGDSMQDDAGRTLEQVSSDSDAVDSAAEDLSELMEKASSLGEENGGSEDSSASKAKGGEFGIGISGSASVNIAHLGARSELDGATIQNTTEPAQVTVQALDQASLTSLSGAAALRRGESGTGGAIAGAVAYSDVANTTTAQITDSELNNVNDLAVRALDGSLQVDVALGIAANTSNGTSATLAGSVSVARSGNTTHAGIEGGSTVDGGSTSTSKSKLDVTAYDHSRIGVGGGSLYFNKSSSGSANAGIGFTYADIANTTTASLSGHTGALSGYDIDGYDTLKLRALDSSLIGAGAVAGGYTTSKNGASLAGAIVWTQIGNTTKASVDSGMRLNLDGDALIEASAVAPISELDTIVGVGVGDRDTQGYDFTGSTLGSPTVDHSGDATPGPDGDPQQPGTDALLLSDSGLGSSIIAVAGTVQIGGNNVGLSYVGNNVHNTHTVSIDGASIDSSGAVTLGARDDTRIIGLAVGAAVSTGQFAGLGSATTNIIGNTDSILLGSAATTGHTASIHADSFQANAADQSHIYSLAGNVALGKGQAAAGGAVTYNDIANTVTAHAGATRFDVTGSVGMHADESAQIMAGAVAAAASKGFALTLSFGWNQTGDTNLAGIDEGSTITAGALDVGAENSSTIYALTGGVSIGGKAAVGLAGSVSDIADQTTAKLDDVGLDVAAGAVNIDASGTGKQYALSVAGAVGAQGAGVAGSDTSSLITSNVTASADSLYAVKADGSADKANAVVAKSLSVSAQNTARIYSLAGGVGIGQSVGVGAAAAISDVGGATTASLSNALLDVADTTDVLADAGTTIDTASIAGSAASSVAVSASDTTNLIHNSISASMSNVGSIDSSAIDSVVTSTNQTKVRASNNATINALAGAVGGAGSVAVGAAVAVNNINVKTSASFFGDGVDGPLYKTGQLQVQAGTSDAGSASQINTIAVGAAGGGSTAVAGSVAVNLLSSTTSASIDKKAHVTANDNVGVLAGNKQGIDVFAGQAAIGGDAGVGLGVVINKIGGSTSAAIDNSDVSAYGNNTALSVDAGTAANADTLESSLNIAKNDADAKSISDPSNYVTPDLTGDSKDVHGVAVNAFNQQHIATLGIGASISGGVAVSGLVGVNVVGGSTSAQVSNSNINRADRVNDADGVFYTQAALNQGVDVSAGSRQFESNFVANIAGSGSGAAAGSVATNIFDGNTDATMQNSIVSAKGKVAVDATGQQWSLATGVGAAVSGGISDAASGAVTLFQASTVSTLDGGTLDVGGLDVLATGSTVGAQFTGALGIGVEAAGLAGAAAVNVDDSTTTAIITGAATVVADDDVNVKASSRNVAQAIVVGTAGSGTLGVAGGALVNVISNHTHANIEGDSNITGGNVSVDAVDDQVIDAYSGVLSGGLVGVGGGINLTLLQLSVGAKIADSAVIARGAVANGDGKVDVQATSNRDIQSAAVAGAVGAVSMGLSASVVVVGTGDISDGGDAGKDLHTVGQLNLGDLDSLSSGNKLDSDPSSYGLDDKQLSSSDLFDINDSATYTLSGATGSSSGSFGKDDSIQATISGGSVNALNTVSVHAQVNSGTDNIAGGGAVGVVGLGGSVAYTTLNSDIGASVGDGIVTSGHGTTITASAADNGGGGAAAKSQAYAGVGGLVGIGAAVAISHIDNTVQASAAGTIKSSTGGQGVLTVKASDTSSSQAGNDNLKIPGGVNVGGVVAGAVFVDARRSSTVSAKILDHAKVSGFASTELTATDNGQIKANGVMGSGGILTAISAVVAKARDSSIVTASIGTSADINAGSTSVSASASPQMVAGATGITVGGIGGGIGANEATASMTASAIASVGDDAIFHAGNLSVNASVAPGVKASSSGGAGAALLGVNASTATASDTATVKASVGKRVKLPSGNVSIAATSDTKQRAEATGVSIGLVSAGASIAKATSDTHIEASLGDGALDSSNKPVALATTGALSVVANGSDTNIALSKAGSGGLVSGNGAEATTGTTSVATASVGQYLGLENLGSFQLSATQNMVYGGAADSELAAAIGGSGANVYNTLAATTDARIGDGTMIMTGSNIDVLAKTILSSDSSLNNGATGGAGGVVTGSAAGVDTSAASSNTITVGSGVQLVSGLDGSSNVRGHISMVAGTAVGTMRDMASMSSGGAVPIVNANVSINGMFSNDLSIGDGSSLLSYGRTNLGTYSALSQVAAVATSNSFGAAAVGAADASVKLTSNQHVGVGNNVKITSYDEADIVAGKNILGLQGTKLAPTAVAQSFVRGLIAIPHASATANAVSNATLSMGSGTVVKSAGDVAVGAVQGDATLSTNGTGHGYELGFIPATQHSNHQNSTGTVTSTLDGQVTAGAFDTINLAISADGTITDTGTTAPYEVLRKKTLNPTEYLNILDATSERTYSGIDNANVGGFIFDPLYAGGGNVYLYGQSIGGNGTVTANGSPSISIDNASPYYMFLPSITTSFGSSGSVRVSGGATSSSLGNLQINEAPSNALPTVTINSTYAAQPGGKTPGIILGDVSNLGGPLKIKNLAGSLLERGEIRTNSQDVYVPNGYVVVRPEDGGGTWFSGGDPTSNLQKGWISQFLSSAISSPNDAAAVIANSNYSLRDSVYKTSHFSDEEAAVVVLYGSCAPHSGGSGSEDALDGCNYAGPYGSTSVLNRNVPTIPYRNLQQSGTFDPGTGLASGGAYTGQKFIVEAEYIDIDGTINAGTPATWAVQTTDALKDWIAHENQLYQQGQISDPNIRLATSPNDDDKGMVSLTYGGKPLLEVTGADASQLIGATYNVVTKQLVLDNVAASGGGSVSLDGKVVSTAHGSINVNSGYGSVTVDNTSGVPLVVQNVFAGSGGLGLITINDHLKTWASGPNAGASQITWYVSQNGNPAKIYDNYNGAKDWTESNVRLLGNVSDSTKYTPKAGTEYQWSARTQITRTVEHKNGQHPYWSLGKWSGVDTSGGTAGQHWTLKKSHFIDGSGSSGYVDLGGNDYQLSLTGTFTPEHSDKVSYHGCDGDDCHYGSKKSASDASIWDYYYPTDGTLTVSDTQRADLPIGIHFVTSSSNNVNITSNNDILLSDQITNANGPTTLTATDGGSIIQATDKALIWTHSLSMNSTSGYVGSEDKPLQVRIVHDANNPDSMLSAAAGGGDIVLNVDSGSSAQQLHAVAQGSSGYGNVQITTTGSMLGIDGQVVDVVGRDVNLTSMQGNIGSLTKPLNIETHPEKLSNGAFAGGQLDAHAVGDIGLSDSAGDVWVGSLVADSGDISLNVSNGGIYDARQLDAASTLSSDQAKKIWTNMHLTDGTAAQSTVTAIQYQVDAGYAQYYQLLKVGQISGGSYTLNSDAVDLYWPLAAASNGIAPSSVTDPAQRASLAQAYASGLYDKVVSDFVTYIGPGWKSGSAFAGPDPVASYSFKLDTNSTAYDDLTKNSRWTEAQLTSAINQAALGTPAGGTVGATVEPNISGRNVSLVAGKGGIGRTDTPLMISYQALKDLYNGNASALTSTQVTTLGLANAPGDVQLINASGNLLSVNDPDLAAKLDRLSIVQTMPLYVSVTGAMTGSATGSAYLQSSGDLHFDSFSADADMRIAASGSIDAAPGVDVSKPVLDTAGDLLLTAGGGHISLGNGSKGDAGDPLPVQISGELRNASAATDVVLSQLTGDLRIGTVFANGLVSLSAPHGSILAQLGSLSIQGQDITLSAADDIGQRLAVSSGVDAPLKLQVGADGELNADAGGAVNIDSPVTDLHVGTITSGGNMLLTAEQGGLDAQHLVSTGGTVLATAGTDGSFDAVQAHGDITLGAAGNLDEGTIDSTAGNVTLTAVTGMQLQKITALAGTITAKLIGTGMPVLDLGDNGRLQASSDVTLKSSGSLSMGTASEVLGGGTVRLTSTGTMTLGKVASTATSDLGIALDAGDSIQGNGDALNLQQRSGGDVQLHAVNDIGSATRPIVVDVDTLGGSSDQGSIWLRGLGDLHLSDLEATSGSLQLAADDTLSYDTLVSSLDSTLDATNLVGTTLTAGGAATLTSTQDTTVSSIQTGTTLVMDAGGNLTADDLNVGTDATLTAGGTLQYTTLASGNDSVLQATDIAGTTLTAGGAATLTSTQDTTVSSIQTGTTLVMDAGGNLTADDLNVGTDATLTAGGTLQYTTLASGNDSVLQATDIAGTTLTAGGAATLTSTQDTTVSSVQTGTTLVMDAGGNLTAKTLDVGTDASLDAGKAIELTDTATTGGDLQMTSGSHMGFATLNAGGHVFGQSLHGDIDGTQATATDWIEFIAADSIDIDSMHAGTDVTLQAGNDITSLDIVAGRDADVQGGGDIALTSTTAGRAIKVDAGGALTVHDMHAGHSLDLAASTMSFATLDAPDSITLLARKGDIIGATLTTRDADIAAFGAIHLDAANIGDRINLAGNTIDAHIAQTSTGQPLYSVMTGYQGGVAQRITVDADAPEQWMIDRLSAVNAALATTAPSARIEQGHIEKTLSLDTSMARVRMNQHSAVLVPADVQLMQQNEDFLLYQDGVHMFSNAFVVRYGIGYQIQTPNYVATHGWLAPDYYGDAAIRYNGRTLTLHTDDISGMPRKSSSMQSWGHADDSQLVQPDPSTKAPAVNIKAPL